MKEVEYLDDDDLSTFTCSVCGCVSSGDSLYSVEMVQCNKTHVFCEKHLTKIIPKEYTDSTSDLYDIDVVNGITVPCECCPICSPKKGKNNEN